VPHGATEHPEAVGEKGLSNVNQSLNGLQMLNAAYGIDVVKEQPAHLYPFFFTNALRFKPKQFGFNARTAADAGY
jgi:hypothetical protein